MSRPTLYRLPVARGNTAAGIYLGAIGAVAGIVFASIWMTTQVTAYRLHFHPALGASSITIGSPYRELLGPAAILVAMLGVGGLMMPAWRSVVPFASRRSASASSSFGVAKTHRMSWPAPRIVTA